VAANIPLIINQSRERINTGDLSAGNTLCSKYRSVVLI